MQNSAKETIKSFQGKKLWPSTEKTGTEHKPVFHRLDFLWMSLQSGPITGASEPMWITRGQNKSGPVCVENHYFL